MGGQVGAPISLAFNLKRSVTLTEVSDLLAEWLRDTHHVPLESATYDDFVVEWRSLDGEEFTCQLVVSDEVDQIRRTVYVLRDDNGVVGIVEEAPLTTTNSPHSIVDLSHGLRLLLDAFTPILPSVAFMDRGVVNRLDSNAPAELLAALDAELTPGLVCAVTVDGQSAPSTGQHDLLDGLRGIALVGTVAAKDGLLANLSSSARPQAGSVVSIQRTTVGLDVSVVPSTSIRTKPKSARRLVVRRQLSAPIPFNLERRRSAAMTRLLAHGAEVDLPTALQLLDEESQRANELDNRLKEIETQLERALDEQDAALGELDDALSRIRYLERAFRDLGQIPTTEPGFDDDWQPDSVHEALEAARELLPFLVFSSTDRTCIDLDGQQKRGIWAKKIWTALRALNDYCRAKTENRFTGDLFQYRINPPQEAIPLLPEYASSESEPTTNDDHLRAIRTFSIPAAVVPAGKVYMEQHVKIDRGGHSAPRIHLYDDSGGPSQRIYIGYIGPHLPTSSGF